MSLAVGNIIKVTDYMTYLGQVMENVYFYRITAIPEPFTDETVDEAICHAFNAQVRIFVIGMQSGAVTHTVTRMDNVSNGIDFAELAVPVTGVVSGEGAPSFAALNFVLRRSNGLTRNGSKRIGGLSEEETNGNSLVLTGTPLLNLQNALAAKLTDASAPTPVEFADPVIVGRKLYTTSDGKPAYELDLTKINPIASAAFTAVSTQRSRKVGHGS